MTVGALLIFVFILITVLAISVVLTARYLCKMATEFKQILFREIKER